MLILPQKTLDKYDVWAFYENVFTPEECEKLRSSFDFKAAKEAEVGNNNSVDHKLRKTLLNWIKSTPDTHWIYDKLATTAMGCNEHRWKFHLSGFLEGIQFGHYMQGSFYNWHQDNGNFDFSKRKLSMVVQLSKPEDYEGGDLEFILGGKSLRAEGSVIVFPSYQVHRVTPILTGSRFSLAAWISGDSYR